MCCCGASGVLGILATLYISPFSSAWQPRSFVCAFSTICTLHGSIMCCGSCPGATDNVPCSITRLKVHQQHECDQVRRVVTFSKAVFIAHRNAEGNSVTTRMLVSGIFICSVIFFVPQQLAFLIITLMFLLSSPSGLSRHATVTLLLLSCLPFTGPVLIVWLRNVAAHWRIASGFDHSILCILGPLVWYELNPATISNSFQTSTSLRPLQYVTAML